MTDPVLIGLANTDPDSWWGPDVWVADGGMFVAAHSGKVYFNPPQLSGTNSFEATSSVRYTLFRESEKPDPNSGLNNDSIPVMDLPGFGTAVELPVLAGQRFHLFVTASDIALDGTDFAVTMYPIDSAALDFADPYDAPVVSSDPAEALNEALIGFSGCIGEALDDICSYGLTIGETYVPFDPDPEDDCPEEEVACSQAWVRVMGIQTMHETDSFDNGDCGATMGLSLEVGVLRCFGIEEEGAAPTATDVLAASMQAMTDMNAIYCAAMGCEVWGGIKSGAWIPSGPMGGQYGGIWTFDVEMI